MQDTPDISRIFRPWDVVVSAVFLTRLPMPRAPEAAFDHAHVAVWAYPLVGTGLGLIATLVWWLCGWIGFGVHLQAGLSLAAVILMTGGLHEDGLADTADGLWGGQDPERRLDIMKDSRIGSYGVLALVFGIGLRWLAVSLTGPVAFVAALSLSRGVLPGMMALGAFARDTGLAHSLGKPPRISAWASFGIALCIALLCAGISYAMLCGIIVIGLAWGFMGLATRKIGGITGDILGATQQICELGVLLVLVAAL